MLEKRVCRIVLIFVCRVIKITKNTGAYAEGWHSHMLASVSAGRMNAGALKKYRNAGTDRLCRIIILLILLVDEDS
jgi:hypothetical protein